MDSFVCTLDDAVESLEQGVNIKTHKKNISIYCMYSYMVIIANQRQFMILHLYSEHIDLYTLTYQIHFFIITRIFVI